MATFANCSHPERKRVGGAVFTDVPGYHCSQTTNRNRRHKRRGFISWTKQVCKVSKIRYKKQKRTHITMDITSAQLERYGQTIQSSAYDESKCRCNAPVPARSSQNTSPHSSSLLCVQSYLGLGHSLSYLLHSYHGSLQRRIQEQNLRRCLSPSRRFYSRCDLLHRYRSQFSYNIRRSRWRSCI
uniref:Uncharacterized protein n=1 Tax=Cacopsylla melanoneura TaxID=428564 RepID=A0A8D9AD39_9HEMI